VYNNVFKTCYDCETTIRGESKRFILVTKHFSGRCMIDKCKRSIPHEHVLCKNCLDNEKEKEKVNILTIFYLITNQYN